MKISKSNSDSNICPLGGSYFASAEIAGAGFLNFRLNPSWYAGVSLLILYENI